MNFETVVDLFKALLTPVIGILTAVIAVAQYRLAEAKFRHELYERRLQVYRATMKFIAHVTSSGFKISITEAHTFLRDTSEAAFLFKQKRIPDYLKTLYKQSVDLYVTYQLLESERGTEASLREQRGDKAYKLGEWFDKQFDECTRLFASELSLV